MSVSQSGMTPTGIAAIQFGSGSEDLRIRHAAHRALHGRGYPGLWNVRLEVEDGMVRLSGAVGSYYLKQLAQSAILALDGVRELDNRLEVI